MFDRIKEGKDGARPENRLDLTLRRRRYEHQHILNAMLKAITLCPMDDELKMILRMRIWGRNPLIFAPMRYDQIAQDPAVERYYTTYDLPSRINDIERWENDALNNVTEFLAKMDIPAIGERFNRDNRIRDLLDPPKRIIV